MSPKTKTTISSPLVSALNNIVSINRSGSTMKSTQQSYQGFLKFMDVEIGNIESIKLPKKRDLEKLSNLNVAATFGSAGSLLSSLASGALDVAGLVGNLFGGGRGKSKPNPKAGGAIPKGKGIRLGGLRAIGITNALFAGLDFAQGLQEGESVGKAASGAGGALAGSLLGGAIGQALIPIPGLGFVVGSIAGNFLGGYAGDRAHEAVTGTGNNQDLKSKQKEKLKAQETKQKAAAMSSGLTMSSVLDKFDSVVTKFEKASPASISESGSRSMEEGFGEKSNEGGAPVAPEAPTQPYDGPVSGDTFFPLPKGIISNRSVGVEGGEYGAKRSYGGHSGQDIGGLPPGSPVVAWKTGKVRYTGSVESGDTIMTLDHGGGEQSVYKHVVPTVPAGAVVYGGQQIAKLFAARAYPEHLHFEVWKNGSHTNPNGYITSAQKIPAPLTASKAKEQSEKSSEKGPVASSPGTTPPPDKSQKPAAAPPPPSPEMTKNFQMAWDNRNNGLARGRIESSWNDMNVEQQQQAKVWAKSTGKDWTEMRLKEKTPTVQPPPSMVAPIPSSQKSVPEQIQQYPTYNQSQSSTLIVPMMMSSGGGQRRPQVISVPGARGETIVLPGPTDGQLVNSLFKTMLLTSLSGS
jgi:murein DD-endopeptidase MepM/ murein hydrolase activator NlpD